VGVPYYSQRAVFASPLSLSAFLFLIYSVHNVIMLPVGGAEPRTFAPGGKNHVAATAVSKISVFKKQKRLPAKNV